MIKEKTIRKPGDHPIKIANGAKKNETISIHDFCCDNDPQ